MNASDRELIVCPDPAALATRAADLFRALAAEAASEYRSLSVALAGGSTPRAMYALLASDAYHRGHWRNRAKRQFAKLFD